MRKVAIIVAAVFAAAVGVVPAATAQPTDFDLQAHRGGRGETTEESLRALTKSLDLGVSTLEFDIVITEDVQPLVWHDPKIDPAQVCRHRARLRRRLGVSIRRQAGSRPHPRPDSHAGLRRTAQGLSHCRSRPGQQDRHVARGFRAHRRAPCGCEIQHRDEGGGRGARNFGGTTGIRRRDTGRGASGRQDGQGRDSKLRLAHAADGASGRAVDPLVALWDETTSVPGSPWLAGIDPAVVTDPIAGAQLVGANILSPGYSVPYGMTPKDPGFALIADRAFNDRAHAAGLKVIPWTINDPDAMRAQIAAGADGIITDYPSRLRAVMKDLGMPLPPAYRSA